MTKEQRSAQQAKWYLNNKDRLKAKALQQKPIIKKRNKDFVYEYLSTHPCVDCGQTNPIVLDFDHIIGDKVADVSDLYMNSLDKIKVEIAKCEVRCANCHRIVTHYRRLEKEALK